MKSIVQPRGNVQFPEFTRERVYMREFKKKEGLPFDLRRWQPTVDAMLHESTPVVESCNRTLVRINVPGWTPLSN